MTDYCEHRQEPTRSGGRGGKVGKGLGFFPLFLVLLGSPLAASAQQEGVRLDSIIPAPWPCRQGRTPILQPWGVSVGHGEPGLACLEEPRSVLRPGLPQIPALPLLLRFAEPVSGLGTEVGWAIMKLLSSV